jgi:hypothetical protein
MNLSHQSAAVITRPASIGSRGLVVSALQAEGMGYRVQEFYNSFVIPGAGRRRR